MLYNYGLLAVEEEFSDVILDFPGHDLGLGPESSGLGLGLGQGSWV